jgi:hypothetical protein
MIELTGPSVNRADAQGVVYVRANLDVMLVY